MNHNQSLIYSYQNKVPHNLALILAVVWGLVLVGIVAAMCFIAAYLSEWWILLFAAIIFVSGLMPIALLK